MAGLSLEPPKAMNFNAKSLADNWKIFKGNFLVYDDAAELQKKKGSTQVAILLHCAGEGASDRFEKLEFSDSGQDKSDNIEAFLEKFRNLCEPKKNIQIDLRNSNFLTVAKTKETILKHSWKSSEIYVNQKRIFFMARISSFKKSNYQVNFLNVF